MAGWELQVPPARVLPSSGGQQIAMAMRGLVGPCRTTYAGIVVARWTDPASGDVDYIWTRHGGAGVDPGLREPATYTGVGQRIDLPAGDLAGPAVATAIATQAQLHPGITAGAGLADADGVHGTVTLSGPTLPTFDQVTLGRDQVAPLTCNRENRGFGYDHPWTASGSQFGVEGMIYVYLGQVSEDSYVTYAQVARGTSALGTLRLTLFSSPSGESGDPATAPELTRIWDAGEAAAIDDGHPMIEAPSGDNAIRVAAGTHLWGAAGGNGNNVDNTIRVINVAAGVDIGTYDATTRMRWDFSLDNPALPAPEGPFTPAVDFNFTNAPGFAFGLVPVSEMQERPEVELYWGSARPGGGPGPAANLANDTLFIKRLVQPQITGVLEVAHEVDVSAAGPFGVSTSTWVDPDFSPMPAGNVWAEPIGEVTPAGSGWQQFTNSTPVPVGPDSPLGPGAIRSAVLWCAGTTTIFFTSGQAVTRSWTLSDEYTVNDYDARFVGHEAEYELVLSTVGPRLPRDSTATVPPAAGTTVDPSVDAGGLSFEPGNETHARALLRTVGTVAISEGPADLAVVAPVDPPAAPFGPVALITIDLGGELRLEGQPYTASPEGVPDIYGTGPWLVVRQGSTTLLELAVLDPSGSFSGGGFTAAMLLESLETGLSVDPIPLEVTSSTVVDGVRRTEVRVTAPASIAALAPDTYRVILRFSSGAFVQYAPVAGSAELRVTPLDYVPDS